MNEQTGYIYLIKAGEHYKIGKSVNVAQRMRQFQLPIPIELLHTIAAQDMGRVESYLHKRFADQRVRGEWFALSPDDITWMCSLESLEPLPELPQPEPTLLPSLDDEKILKRSDLLDVQEAVEHSGLTKQRLYQLGEKVGYQIGSTWIFSKKKLDAYKEMPKSKGGRPPGSKTGTVTPSPVVAVM